MTLSNPFDEVCRCACHREGSTHKHLYPCCAVCPHCDKRIKGGLVLHEKECKQVHDRMMVEAAFSLLENSLNEAERALSRALDGWEASPMEKGAVTFNGFIDVVTMVRDELRAARAEVAEFRKTQGTT